MRIELQNVGKRYRFEWVFRNFSHSFDSNSILGVKGPNGSGKSTLLKILSGFLSHTEGKVSYSDGSKSISRDDIFTHVDFTAPYIGLIEEFTLQEAVDFHHKMKGFSEGRTSADVIEEMGLIHASKKYLRDFSSGMKQRCKLAIALLSPGNILLLDEPGTNLDSEGLEWYKKLLDDQKRNRLVVVASNDESDFPNGSTYLHMPGNKF